MGSDLNTDLTPTGKKLMLVAAAIVLIPGSPLGLLTEGVQTLAGVPNQQCFSQPCSNTQSSTRKPSPWASSPT